MFPLWNPEQQLMNLETVRENSLAEQLETAIQNSPYLKRNSLKLEMHEGHVSLKGRVRSFHHKQMAQEALRGIEGIQAICNELEVEYHA